MSILIRVYTADYSICFFWTNYCIIKHNCFNFRTTKVTDLAETVFYSVITCYIQSDYNMCERIQLMACIDHFLNYSFYFKWPSLCKFYSKQATMATRISQDCKSGEFQLVLLHNLIPFNMTSREHKLTKMFLQYRKYMYFLFTFIRQSPTEKVEFKFNCEQFISCTVFYSILSHNLGRSSGHHR